MATRTKGGRPVTSPSINIASLKEPTFPTQRMTQSVKKTALIHPLASDGYQTHKFSTLQSQWTPILHKPANDTIFVERRNLIGHWFAMWTDAQRKQFLDYLLHQCKRTQLHYLQSWFHLRIPVRHADFTMYLPRFLSLYIFSFLDPRSLSQAASVCWHWAFLAEQDTLWMPKCVRLGWLLPYVPLKKEYGAWKTHYIKCLQSLNVDYNDQRDTYGLLGDGLDLDKNKSKKNTQKDYTLVPVNTRTPWLDPDPNPTDLQRGYKAMMHSQNTNAPTPSGTASIQNAFAKRHQRSWTEPSWQFEYGLASSDRKSQHRALQRDEWNTSVNNSKMTLSASLDLETSHIPGASTIEPNISSPVRKPVTRRKDLSAGGSTCTRHINSNGRKNSFTHQPQPRVLLLSSHVPSVQMLFASVKSDVCVVLYDYDGATLESIQKKLLETLGDRQAMSIGIFTSGIAQIELTPYRPTNSLTLDHPDTKHFWETLCSHVLPTESGGCVDVFAPLAATDSGSSLLWQIGRLTGMQFISPMTTSASSQYTHSKWHGCKQDFNATTQYFQLDRLEAWLAMSDRVQEAIDNCKTFLRPYFKQTQDHILADILGELIFEALPMMNGILELVTPALIAALSSLQSQSDVDQPLAYLGQKLLETSGMTISDNCDNEISVDLNGMNTLKGKKETANIKQVLSDSESISEEIEEELDALDAGVVVPSVQVTNVALPTLETMTTKAKNPMRKLALKVDYQLGGSGQDRRKFVAQQLLLSEKAYYQQLRTMRDVYYKPLLAALNSNNAIISQHNLKMIFTDINNLVPVSRELLEELQCRLDQWGIQQCIGDCFVKFQGKLKTFTNFHNNYSTALVVLDKCREQQPAFRAFLKTHNRSPSTHMKTLPELMLAPTRRIMEYSRLLMALEHWTPEEHPDRQDLAKTLDVFKQLQKFGDECKHRLEREAELVRLQNRIKNCPSLLQANRYLIHEYHVAQWEQSNPNQTGVFTHIKDLSLFLFNDALLVTHRSSRHIPYTQRCETRMTYHSSVALKKLLVTNIPDSKFLQNAFKLKTPKRAWICATESYVNKVSLFALLEDAIQAANED